MNFMMQKSTLKVSCLHKDDDVVGCVVVIVVVGCVFGGGYGPATQTGQCGNTKGWIEAGGEGGVECSNMSGLGTAVCLPQGNRTNTEQ